MAQEYQYVCDGCGEMVHGKRLGQFYHRDYLQVRGQVVLQGEYNKVTGKNSYTYLTYNNKLSDDPSKVQVGEELTFCVKRDMPCMAKWIDRRHNEILFRREEKRKSDLREIRKQEILAGDDDYTPRR